MHAFVSCARCLSPPGPADGQTLAVLGRSPANQFASLCFTLGLCFPPSSSSAPSCAPWCASANDNWPLNTADPCSVSCAGCSMGGHASELAAAQHRTWRARTRVRGRHTSSVHWDWPPKSESAAVRNDASRRSAPSSWNENHTRSRSTDMSHENAWRAIGASCEIHAPGPEEASRRGVAPSGDAAAAARRAGTSHRRVRAAAAARPAARRSIVSVMPPHSRRGLGVA